MAKSRKKYRGKRKSRKNYRQEIQDKVLPLHSTIPRHHRGKAPATATISSKDRKKLKELLIDLSIPSYFRKSNEMLVKEILDVYDYYIHRAQSSEYPDFGPANVQRLVDICPPKDWLLAVTNDSYCLPEEGDMGAELGIHTACAYASMETVMFLAQEMPESMHEGFYGNGDTWYPFDKCQRERETPPNFSFGDLKELLLLCVSVSCDSIDHALENDYPIDLLQLMTKNLKKPRRMWDWLHVYHDRNPEHLEVLASGITIPSKFIRIRVNSENLGSESFISLMNILAEKDEFVGKHLVTLLPSLDKFDHQQKQQMVAAFRRMLHKSPTIVALGYMSEIGKDAVDGLWLEAVNSLATSATGNRLVDLLLAARVGQMWGYGGPAGFEQKWTITYTMLREAPGNWCHCFAAKSEQKSNLGIAHKYRLANARKHRKKKKHLAELFTRLLTPRNERICDRSDDTLVQTILNIYRKDPQLTLERYDSPVLKIRNAARSSPLFTAMHYFLWKNVYTSRIRKFLLELCPDKEQIMTEYDEDGVENGMLPMHIACWRAREETILFLAKEMPMLLGQKYFRCGDETSMYPFHMYQLYRSTNGSFDTMEKLLELEPVPIPHFSLQRALDHDYPIELLKLMAKTYQDLRPRWFRVSHDRNPKQLEVLAAPGAIPTGSEWRFCVKAQNCGVRSFISLMSMLATNDCFVRKRIALMLPDSSGFDEHQTQSMVRALEEVLRKDPTILALGDIGRQEGKLLVAEDPLWLGAIYALASTAQGNILLQLLFEAQINRMQFPSEPDGFGKLQGRTITYEILRQAPGNWCRY